MAKPKTIRVMISSRCSDPIQLDGEPASLTDIRLRIKKELEQATFLDSQLLEVWVNEDAPPAAGSNDSWATCLKQVDECHILVVLFNGNAGWAASDDNVGICHAEMEQAMSRAPAKVRLVELEEKTKETANRHKRFQEYVSRLNQFRGATAKTGEDAIQRVKQAVREAVADLAQMGVREAQKGKYHFGEGLDWSRLDYATRKRAIEEVVCDSLGSAKKERMLVRQVARANIMMCVQAIPDAFSTAEARDMVGLPFLRDYELVENMKAQDGNTFGPIHVIAVHKAVGESQARKFLGHPDVFLVNAPFGYYLADRAQHIQVLLIANCRAATSTRYAVQRCLDWINQSGEDINIAERAKKRRRIVDLIAKQIESA